MANPVDDNVNGWRQWIPPQGHPRIAGLDKMSPYEYTKSMMEQPHIKAVYEPWVANLAKPFYGITTDGIKLENLYALGDEGAPTPAMVKAAERLLHCLTPEEQKKARFDIDDESWRKWSNPELIPFDVGIRLEHLQQSQVDLIWALLKESLSDTGFNKAMASVKMNKFLGQVSHSQAILNDKSYFFLLFGDPSESDPWGYTIFGHHLCLNIFVVGNQMTIAPAFIGSEPTMIDSGPDKGVRLMADEAELGLSLMRSLGPEQQKSAQVYVSVRDAAMPEGRLHLADERHLGGAFQDNRIIPYEGLQVSSLKLDLQEQIVSVLGAFYELLPTKVLAHRLALVREHLSETFFCWIGGFGDDDPYYYRIQSPVAFVEFDYHSGIYLLNETPLKHHIHTIQRLPNGGDYGRETIRQWKLARTGLSKTDRSHYIRPVDEAANVESGLPGYQVQVLSHFESAIMFASHIAEGACGPDLHYHHSDQFYYLVRGSMNVRLGDQIHQITAGTFVYIPAGLPHCNWNTGPGKEFHLEMIIPSPTPLEKLAHPVSTPEDVPIDRRTEQRGFVLPIDRNQCDEPMPGFLTAPLITRSKGSNRAQMYYAEVVTGKGGPSTHIHEFDQYYFVLEGQLTIEVALQKHTVGPYTLVILPAGVPHRQYNAGNTTEKHITILAPAPVKGRPLDVGVSFAANGIVHYQD